MLAVADGPPVVRSFDVKPQQVVVLSITMISVMLPVGAVVVPVTL